MSGEAEIRKKKIYRVTFIGFAVNLLLAGIKLAAGILGRSGAMVADAVHSFSDMATDVVVIAFAKISAKPKDEGHDYGHGKYETLATIIISLALAAVGTGILVNSIGAIRVVVDGGLLPRPGTVALLAAAVSIVVKEILYRYTVREGRRVSSPSMIANAWHHRSDALSSLGTLAGIGCAYFLGDKWRIADPIAALVVAVFIFKIAFDLIRTGLDELLERSLPEDVEEEILRVVAANPEVREPHNLRTRRIGASIAVEVHVRVDGTMSVCRSHELTEDIERRLRARFGEGTMIAIHVEPLKAACRAGDAGWRGGFPRKTACRFTRLFDRFALTADSE
ncbi:MAG: cation diffusion facilitator family transporter [Alistipes finegoldii]